MRAKLLLACLLTALLVPPCLAAEKLFVTSSFDDAVEVFLSEAAGPSVARIPVGVHPNQVVASPSGDVLYVANYTTASISAIDPVTLEVKKTLSLSCSPSTLDIDRAGKNAYVVCRNTGHVVQVDLAEGGEVGKTAVTFPSDLVLGGQGRFAYVSRTFFSRVLYVVDLPLQKVVASVPVGRSPKGVAIDSSGEFVYVANAGSGTVSVLETATNSVVQTVTVGPDPNALAIDKAGDRLYVSHRRGNSVSVVDLRGMTRIASVEVGLAPEQLALSADGERLYVTNFDSNQVSVINTQQLRVQSTLPTGNGPYGLALLEPRDSLPPELNVVAEQTVLWPPNHKLRDIHLTVTASDNQDPDPQVRLLSIVSSEPCSGFSASGDKKPKLLAAEPKSCADVVGADYGQNDVDFKLRAERFAYNGDDRIYTITYEAIDAAGNRATESIAIRVPLHFEP